MNRKIKKDAGLGLIAFASLFLFNPIVGFVDVLPDCIGFLLICSGLTLMSDLNGRIADAQKRFQILFWGSVLQALSQFFLYRFLQAREEEMNQYELPVMILLFSFILLVFYGLMMIPAFRDLFFGLERLGERFELSITSKKKRGREVKSPAEKLFVVTVVFILAVTLFNLLPELSILVSFEHDVDNPLFTFDWYLYIGLFRSAAGILSGLFGLIWLISYLRYFFALKKEREWMERMKLHYVETVLPQTEMLTMRRVKFAFLILFVAIFFAIPLRINYAAVLPGALLAFLVFAAILLLGELLTEQKRLYLASGVLGVVSLAELIVNHFYLKYYLPTDSLFYPKAFIHYLCVQALDIAEAIATVWLLFELFGALMQLTTRYTGVDYGRGNGEAQAASATQRLQRAFFVRYNVIFILFFAAGVGTIVDAVFHLSVGWLWLIPLCASVIGVFCFYSVQHDLLEEIGYYFQPDQTNKS